MWSEGYPSLESDPDVAVDGASSEVAGGNSGDGSPEQEDFPEALVEDITRRYLDDIGRNRVLRPDEERILARRMQAGDEQARSILITHNLKLVVHVAKRYLERGLPLLDLVEEGNLGLMHALDKYDPDRGVRLSTYATWWIRQRVELALINQSRTIRLPVHTAKELNRCLRTRRQLELQGMPDAGAEDIARMRDLDVNVVRQLLQLNDQPISLDAPLAVDPDITVGDAIADDRCEAMEDSMHKAEMERYVAAWLKGLNEKHRWVIERRFGLNNQDPASFEELARELGLSAERVRQIQVEALEKLAATLRELGLQREWLL